jgi:ribonuclease HII
MADFAEEARLMAAGTWPVAGVDEAGRGPLAGPVAAAAVILNPDDIPEGIDDSKSMSAKKREKLFDEIMARAVAVAVAFSPAEEIDSINIRQATHAAMRRALNALGVKPVFALIDGNDLPADLPCEAATIVKGDAKSLSIAAASIVAKVTRDRAMAKLGETYPAYGFVAHSGYGSPYHLAALKTHGPCPAHRMTFRPVAEAAAAEPKAKTVRRQKQLVFDFMN